MDFRFLLVLCTTWNLHGVIAEQATRCKPLFMCPTFCMQIQNGCYVCNCDSLMKYLKNSSDEMNRMEQPEQIGSSANVWKDLGRTSISGYSFNTGRNRGPDYPAVGFGQSSQIMPGLNCKPVSTFCPVQCWNTNVYTGCIGCSCRQFPSEGPLHEAPVIKTTTTRGLTKSNYYTAKPAITRQSPTTQASPRPRHTKLSASTVHFEIPTISPRRLNLNEVTAMSRDTTFGQFKMFRNDFDDIKIPTLPTTFQNISTGIKNKGDEMIQGFSTATLQTTGKITHRSPDSVQDGHLASHSRPVNTTKMHDGKHRIDELHITSYELPINVSGEIPDMRTNDGINNTSTDHHAEIQAGSVHLSPAGTENNDWYQGLRSSNQTESNIMMAALRLPGIAVGPDKQHSGENFDDFFRHVMDGHYSSTVNRVSKKT